MRTFFAGGSHRVLKHKQELTNRVPWVPVPLVVHACYRLLLCRARVLLKAVEEALIEIGSRDVEGGAW